MSFPRCNLNLIKGTSLVLTNEIALLSKYLMYRYGIKNGRMKTNTHLIISISVIGVWNQSGYVFIMVS